MQQHLHRSVLREFVIMEPLQIVKIFSHYVGLGVGLGVEPINIQPHLYVHSMFPVVFCYPLS
jgi:hypothetical protein